jgi:hypothetical protein
MNYVEVLEVKYLYIDYRTYDYMADFKIICRTENYGKQKYFLLRFRLNLVGGYQHFDGIFYIHLQGRKLDHNPNLYHFENLTSHTQ